MKTNTARTSSLGIVHPSSNNRIEKAALDYKAKCAAIAKLEEEKDALSARLVIMVRREGEEDEKGKIRYETEQHKFIVIDGKNSYTHGDRAVKELVRLGVRPKLARKAIDAATTEKEYSYVRVDVKGERADEKTGKHGRAS